VENGDCGAKWRNLAQLKADFPSGDYVPPFTVFNVKGNRNRLITLIDHTSVGTIRATKVLFCVRVLSANPAGV
jgi:mRNA-degrading endonuclease HigB of HigAB toxin-antitoxin module